MWSERCFYDAIGETLSLAVQPGISNDETPQGLVRIPRAKEADATRDALLERGAAIAGLAAL